MSEIVIRGSTPVVAEAHELVAYEDERKAVIAALEAEHPGGRFRANLTEDFKTLHWAYYVRQP